MKYILAKSKNNFVTKLQNGDINNEQIAFIQDSDQIWTQGKYYQFIPENSNINQILSCNDNGNLEWIDFCSENEINELFQ